MMNKKYLSVPFFYTDPIAEKGIFPIKGLIWIVYISFLALFCLFFIFEYIQQKQFPVALAMIMVFVIFGLGIIGLFARDIFDTFFFDHIAIKDGCLVYTGSKIFSNTKKSYKINLESKIVWSIEMTTKNAFENSLYIIDADKKKYLLIEKVRLYKWINIWDKFIKDLSELSGLEIVKEMKNT